jgi:Rieske 2Fe-2S family protein
MKTTLPARYYTDAGVFQREMDRFFWNMWIGVGRAEEVACPGDYVLRSIAGDSVIVTRGPDTRVRAFFNVCRHRGTRLCIEAHGRFDGSIQCPYHAWTYGLDGALVAAPNMEGVAGFDKAQYPLTSLAVAEWEGHLFLNGAASPASLDGQLGELPGKMRPWSMGDLKRARRITYDVKANWKLIIANYSECMHCPVIHPALQKLSHYLSGRNDPATPTYVGGRMDLREGVGTMNTDGQLRRPTLPGLSSDEHRRQVLYYALLPNLLLSLHPDYVMTHTLWPVACDRTEIVCEWHFHPEAIEAAGFDPADAVDFWDMTNRQDWHVSELAQLGISSRGYERGPYSDREGLLWDFDRIVERDE